MSPVLSTILNLRNELLKAPYAAIDLEWRFNTENKSKPYTLYAASIVDSLGNIEAKHISDFQSPEPEKELAIWFIQEVLKYQLTMGWYSKGVKIQNDDGTWKGKDSDLKVLDMVCGYYNIPSIIVFDTRGNPYVRGYDSPLRRISPFATINKYSYYYHIDLYKVYNKKFLRYVIYHNLYKDMSLDTVCKAILGEGKYRELDGVEIQKMTKEEQLKYVSRDAGLVMKLSQHDDFKVLDLMNAISQITSITFDKVCQTEVSSWWTKMIEGIVISGEDRFARTVLPKKKYAGGYVLKPKIGFYDEKPIYVMDVKSLYPSMMIAHNISFETVSCKCCENDPEAKVGEKIMISINDNLPEQEKRNEYWICRNPKYRGIVARLLEQFRDERFRQQELGNELIQLALKNLINSCYGLFGTDFFPFRDYRVAELTTAFGREALQYMQHIAKEVFGFELIYGDTDSIFITNVKNEIDVKKFITECYIMFDIDVEISKIYRKFLITKKKHYIGINLENNREIDIKGMEGIKSDRPPWLNKIESQLANDIKDGKDPTVNIRKQYIAMESGQVPLPDLEIRLTLAKNPEKYQQNSLQRVVGTELASSQGDVINYYKSGVIGGGTSNIGLINRRKYLEMLKTTMEDSLKLMGYDYIRDVVGFKSLQDYPRQVPENLCTLPSLMQANQLQSSSRYDTNDSKNAFDFDIRSLIRCQTIKQNGYTYIPCTPAKGVLYITNDNPDFISGQVRMRGKDEGRYPYKYLEMIDAVFGSEYNTIEVCSRSIPGINQRGSCFTVDINSECSPDLVTDGQVLQEIPDNKFNRWRCDPPYNENTARKMYGTSLPKTSRLLQAGARVCKPGSLMFLLLGPTNYQPCPPGVKRIGFVPISIIPNNEFRVLNIFLKLK